MGHPGQTAHSWGTLPGSTLTGYPLAQAPHNLGGFTPASALLQCLGQHAHRIRRPVQLPVGVSHVGREPDLGAPVAPLPVDGLGLGVAAQPVPRTPQVALNWNAPSIAFYEALGARPQDEWTVYRLTDEALAALGGGPGR